MILLGLLTLGSAALYGDTVWEVASATWQDPENVVLQWQAQEGYSYLIYRSDTETGEYREIGRSASGSYRDGDAAYPKQAYYKVQPVSPEGEKGPLSRPIRSGTRPQPLSKVTVLMYHNFITREDRQKGIEFEEYSLDPADFEADLQYFRQNGYTTITSADLLDYINGEKPLPAKALIISIDDGTLGVYTNAWPLLKKYRMKADFNLIGQQIDETWQRLEDGGTREGESAPYCKWEELMEMMESGEIHLCSHTYGLHRYNREGRIGASLMEGESLEDYIELIKEDYRLSVSCITGWTDQEVTTMAYPYSRRSEETDAALLENTGYEILMAGQRARATEANYFVDGASPEGYQRLLSRPCRMTGHPAAEYLAAADRQDEANGVNQREDTAALTKEKCQEIAGWYSPYRDVPGDAWYAGAVYYTYVNSLLTGTSLTEFSPQAPVDRAMAAACLYRLAGEPQFLGENPFEDVDQESWYASAVCWAAEEGLLDCQKEDLFVPEALLSREELAVALYRYGQARGMNPVIKGTAPVFTDAGTISPGAAEAVGWAASLELLLEDSQGRIRPGDSLSRGELAAALQGWGLAGFALRSEQA